METVVGELRLALRTARRTPLFSAAVVLTLGLGIGLSTAIFTVFENVLFRELPVREPGRVIELSGKARGAATEYPITLSQFRRFRSQTGALENVAAIAHWRVIATPLTDGQRELDLRQAEVTEGFFDVLGARPALGRFFQPGDAPEFDSKGPQVYAVVLSYGTWRRAFDGDSAVLGRRLDEPKQSIQLRIVGVGPPGLDYPRGVEAWVAFNYGSLDVVGRLARGATAASARDEFLGFLNRDPDLVGFLGTHALEAQVRSVDETVSGDVKPVLLMLVAAVALLMLIACVNVGNLMLLRAAGRVREMAVRRAIGASVSRLVGQLLAEAALLAVAAGVLGVWFARVLIDALVRVAPSGLPKLDQIATIGWPLATASAVTVVTMIVFGVVPSLGALRFDLSAPLRGGTRAGTEGRSLVRLRSVLVASQIGLAVVVLAGAGLLLRSLQRLTDLNTGYATDHLTMLSVSFPWRKMVADCQPHRAPLTAADTAEWAHCETEANFNAHDDVMAQLRAAPQVVSVSPTAARPFLGSNVWMIKIVAAGETESDAKANPFFGYDLVGAEFFRTLDVPIIAGRAFTDADREGAPPVAIVSEGVARQLWPNESVVGKRFYEPGKSDSLITIVGVVPDLHLREYRDATPMVFRPYRQVFAQGYFVVKTRGAPASASRAVRQAVIDAGAGATFVSAESLDDLIVPQLASPRFETLLLSVFACGALLLAAIGLYGITASAVNQRTRELGIRLALGATPGEVRRMVLRSALSVAVAGAAVGLVAALAALRLVRSMLFDVSPYDPLTLVLVTFLLLLIAVVAAYSPARKATMIDPSRALRAD